MKLSPFARRLPFAFVMAALALGCPSRTTSEADGQPQKHDADDATRTTDGGADAARTTDGGTDASFEDEVLEGRTFTSEIRAAFRVAACGGRDEDLPARFHRALIDEHCAQLRASYDEYRKNWLDVASPFLAKLRPEKLPRAVVYPFGGGDLVSALATFPDADEWTTISLEMAGDIRRIDSVDDAKLERELSVLREHLGKLFLKAHSRTVNLDIETRGSIPGEVAYTMAALVLHGFEPLTLRYFAFERDGRLRWLNDKDLTTRHFGRKGPFSNAEIRFRKPGEPRVRVLRHVAYDLSDKSLRHETALLKHLSQKGTVAVMTKAASHLLWDDHNFSILRDYLMRHTEWMISDTTCAPPRIAESYGFVQDAYGTYTGPENFGPTNPRDAVAFERLFANAQPISFRYGYPDAAGHGHIVVTRKPSVYAAPSSIPAR